MSKLKICLSVIITIIILISCKTTTSNTVTTSEVPPAPPAAGNNRQTEVFDPARVSQAYYTATKEEVQQFIDRLNQIIRTRNYSSWRDALSQEYINEYSSPAKLREISDEPLMKRQNIVLRNLNDYFLQVFVFSLFRLFPYWNILVNYLKLNHILLIIHLFLIPTQQLSY